MVICDPSSFSADPTSLRPDPLPTISSPPLSFTTTNLRRAPPQPLYTNITISPITRPMLPSYRSLLHLLPIPYTKPFFEESLSPPNSSSFAFVASWQDPSPNCPPQIIGGIQGKIELTQTGQPSLYIQTLVLKAPYRRLGVATHLLSYLISRALAREPMLGCVWAHVWEISLEALEWYTKRGFEVEEEIVRGYYRKLKPSGARVVKRMVGITERIEDLIAGGELRHHPDGVMEASV